MIVSGRHLYSFVECKGLVSGSGCHLSPSASLAAVVLGRLQSSLGSGRFVGGPLPSTVRGHKLPRCRSTEQADLFPSGPRFAWVLLPDLIGAPKTHIGGAGVSARQVRKWPRISAPIQRSGLPMALQTFDSSDPGFSLRHVAQVSPDGVSKVLPGFRPNPSGSPHAGAIVASCWPSFYQPAQPTLSAAFLPSALGCEYLRGVSVVQGLPPRPVQLAVWGYAFTFFRGCSILIGFSPTLDGLSLPSMLEALRWLPARQHAQLVLIAAPQSHAFGCEYLRGVSVVQGLPPQPVHSAVWRYAFIFPLRGCKILFGFSPIPMASPGQA